MATSNKKADSLEVDPHAPSPVGTRACEGFAWIGQRFSCCDNCGQPAWDHDGMTRLKEGAAPFDTGGPDWEVRPWENEIVASWLTKGLIDRTRAAALLSIE